MRKQLIYSLMFLTAILLSAACVAACTIFVLRNGERAVLGKNLDWFADPGQVHVNQRGLVKEALPHPDGEPARWVSRYGSVTFNQAGREIPMGGMNEAGLVVETAWLETTEYPEPDGRLCLIEAQWIQYQLDNHATVAEVIASDSLVRITPSSVPTHHLILDGRGDVAVVEFLKGEMVSYVGDDAAFEVLTNSNYRGSVGCFVRGGLTGGNTSLQRFVDATAMIRDYGGGGGDTLIDYSFEILDRVSEEITPEHFTRWSIVYDYALGRIYFRTHDSRPLKYIDIADLDFSCGLQRLMIDIHSREPGRVNDGMTEYTAELNMERIREVFGIYRDHGFMDLSESQLLELAEYPDQLNCIEK